MLSRIGVSLGICALAAGLLGCNSVESRLCAADSYFCPGNKEGISGFETLSANRLYELAIAWNDVIGQGNGYIEKELGRRGEAALEAIVRSPRSATANGFMLSSIFGYIRSETDLDGCKTEYYPKLVKLRHAVPEWYQGGGDIEQWCSLP